MITFIITGKDDGRFGQDVTGELLRGNWLSGESQRASSEIVTQTNQVHIAQVVGA